MRGQFYSPVGGLARLNGGVAVICLTPMLVMAVATGCATEQRIGLLSPPDLESPDALIPPDFVRPGVQTVEPWSPATTSSNGTTDSRIDPDCNADMLIALDRTESMFKMVTGERPTWTPEDIALTKWSVAIDALGPQIKAFKLREIEHDGFWALVTVQLKTTAGEETVRWTVVSIGSSWYFYHPATDAELVPREG